MNNFFKLMLMLNVFFFIQSSIAQVSITEQDLTGDGSIDIKVDNGIMWFQINGEDSVSLRFISAGGISGNSSLVESIGNEQYVDRSYTRPTIKSKVFSIKTNTNELATVLIEYSYVSDNEKPYTQKIEISLAKGSEYANIKNIFENTGTTSFSFAEPSSHIGHGLGVAIVNHSENTNIEAYINGIGDINLTSESWYTNHNIDESKPYIVNYNTITGDAITYGFFPAHSDKNITHVMISYSRSIFLYSDEMTLEPGEIVTFTGVFAFHTGGVDTGTRIYNTSAIDNKDDFSINSIIDVPNDQGRKVRIKWASHPYDKIDSTISNLVTHYSIWRKHDPNLTIHKTSDTPDGEWDFVTEVPAVQDKQYSVIVPTLADSNRINGQYFSTFFVRAHTADPTIHWETSPDSGYSVDNLSPSIVNGLSAEVNTDNVKISWIENPENDLAYYAVYRDTISGFEPNSLDEAIALVAQTEFIDEGIVNYRNYYYRVTAVDYNGNESLLSNELRVNITSVEENLNPVSFQLYQNYPNPFNPSTNIKFSLPEQSNLQLLIFNANGKQIRKLFQGALSRGVHSFTWDGKNEDNIPVGSGVYYYVVKTRDRSLTKKMLLIK